MAEFEVPVLAEPHFCYDEQGALVAQFRRFSRTVDSIIQELLLDRYPPEIVARSVHEGGGIPLATARSLVRDALDAQAASDFDEALRQVEEHLGRSPAEVLAALTPSSYDSVAEQLASSDPDLGEVVATTIVNAVVQAGTSANTISWLETSLHLLDVDAHRPLRVVLYVAADRLGCPYQILPALLAAARREDASFCRGPLETILRRQGVGPIETERQRLFESDDEGDRSKAAQWSYWLSAWSEGAGGGRFKFGVQG